MIATRRQWIIALLVALLLHAAAVLAVLWQLPDSGTEQPGVGGLEVSMGAAGGAPGSVQPEAPETAEAVTEPPEASEVAQPVESATPARPDGAPAAEAVEPEEVLALNEPPPEAPREPEPVEAREPEVADEQAAEAAEIADAETVDASEPAPTEEPTAEPVDAEPEEPTETATVDAAEAVTAQDTPPESESTEPPVTNAEPVEVEGERVTARETGTQGESGTQQTRDTGSGTSTAAGGAPGMEDYKARLRAHLEQHKEYPRRARARRQEGVCVLRFVVDRRGDILDYEIVENSGHQALDDATRAMIQRAEPLPAFPDDMGRERLELTVPVRFSLN